MPIHSIFRFKNHALMMALAAAFPLTSYGAGAAKVDFAVGAVNAVSAAGAQRTINKGAELGSGESIVTGDGGRAQLRFTDGGMVSLQPGSEFKVDNYHFSGKEDGEEKGFFSLLKGGLRTITGLVGRNNKNAYKVNTSVATIGIRGTEFTIAYTGTNSLSVSTGEGMIEVCNNVGCVIIPAGSSANVSGPDTQIKRTEIKPRLDPAQPLTDVQPVFSTSDDRQPDGLVAPVSAPLVSGNGNYVAYAGTKGGSPTLGLEYASTNAQFDAVSLLTSFSDSYGAPYAAGAIAGGFSMDGVIGWGRWSTGAYDSSTALKDFHYVAGTPTPSAQMTALGGLVATYTLAGFTTPTTSTGLTGSNPTATLTGTFGGSSSLALSIFTTVSGTSYSTSMTGSNSGASLSFSGASGSANGFFAGANASHAGLTYKFDSGSTPGDIMGALVFKRQ